ncbi:MAG: 2-oxoacid:acceptor oxidoreductase subunit alpha [Desulfurococcaceae archaeon]|nr:2-oxoacid:acceptor oxidoreductase subunit alpha [Desulfurococcaceae archaeon]
MKEIGIILGGPQGAGLETSMAVLGRALARKGYGVIADREYFSNITGRHSYIHMLISSTRLPRSLRYPVEILASIDAETIFTHFDDVVEKGVVIYDENQLNKNIDNIPSIEDYTREKIKTKLAKLGVSPVIKNVVDYLEKERNIKPIEIDFTYIIKLLTQRFKIDPRQASRYVSGLIVSAVSIVIGLEEKFVKYGFEQQFRERRYLIEHNIALYELVNDSIARFRNIVKIDEPKIGLNKLMIVTGNDVVAIAKIVAGVRYQSYYPITPAADESFTIEKYEYNEVNGKAVGPIVVMQTEDEIAAICSAIGASLSGSRSSTATSGPGFDLMVEGLSFAGANEVPVVITYYQRGGPSTGQPTRGSQSDLMNAVFAAHGEFTRVVLSSGDHVEAFYDTIEAFNIAEKYQVPVIHLLDKFLANTIASIPVPDIDKVRIDRGKIVFNGPSYKRFDLSNLISPRAYLGSDNIVMWYSGDEHDEYGHIVEDPENRLKMYSKRIEKMKLILEETPLDIKMGIYGDKNPDYVIIGWGSVKGVALDTIETLSSKLRLRYINMKLLWPFPRKEFLEIVKDTPSERIIAVEHSYGVNIASLIAMATGVTVTKKIAKFTGRPITLNEMIEAVERIIFKNERHVVLSYGA